MEEANEVSDFPATGNTGGSLLTQPFQDSIERQFLLDTPLQYIVETMKRRDYEYRTDYEFEKSLVKLATRRRIAGMKQPHDWSPSYAKPVNKQVGSAPISAAEMQCRIYSASQTNTDFWSRLKRVNGKDFQLFWCIEDYIDKDGKPLDAHAALFIAGLHTEKLKAKYSTDPELRAKYGDDYGVRDIIAQCIRQAGLSVAHTTAHKASRSTKYESQIHSCFDLQVQETAGGLSVAEKKIHYLTKSINDASGSMCFGSNRKLERKYSQFIKEKTNDQCTSTNQEQDDSAQTHGADAAPRTIQ